MSLADPLGVQLAAPEAVLLEEAGERFADDQRRELLLCGLLRGVDDVGRAHGRGILSDDTASNGGLACP